MNVMQTPESGYFDADTCDLKDFGDLVLRETNPADVPQASEVAKNIPIYDISGLRDALLNAQTRRALMAEWARVFHHGPGIVVLRNPYTDTSAIDIATGIFQDIIKREKEQSGGGADHFAAGTNDRIWNSLQKLCEADAETHIRYFANPAIDAICEAWLGPNYQMTAQVNVVYPGGAAQRVHRDYHLGFQTADISARYPAHVHDLSPLMTLQGGIAHCDVPVESGPTKLLPYSQAYRPGYVAWRREEFGTFFEEHHVQLPLSKGDALFFNPALFHAAGSNTSENIDRMVNLLQVSSAFGRSTEAVDRATMSSNSLVPLQRLWQSKTLSEAELDAAIASTAEGYSFPTNLDSDPPVGGLAPKSQAALLKEAVVANTPQIEFDASLTDLGKRQCP